MKKLMYIGLGLIIGVIMALIFVVTDVYAYNPHSFTDEEIVTVQGNRPKVDIELSEIIINVSPEDFVDGIFEHRIIISNDGNVPCRLKIELQNVPIDLNVQATVDSDFLLKNESTNLKIYVELSEMQETESFTFKILVEAKLRP